ncbi:MAG: phytase [Candidatus Marinimicrobia bacterium]|jgi:3-phytase|nr:phytase [Candidatus Neomarinimicrobiota bacterium]MBT3630090.1 phytase [Candidatus Neomarinimicrobiota bacterium]MBT3824257.1 phytase [Candidatus Neomarinimicrobiota bacterium]MBT4131709.1 phytase [Candidatus Neomarinimicrobiota bacterium]MBT4295461.1 phytase [Candidatus Neomarinimicrobiota bacterium]
MKALLTFAVLLMLLLMACSQKVIITDPVASVYATMETAPVPINADAADDPCIWIHPTDPSLSTIIGTHKEGTIGLLIYDLEGNELSQIAEGRMNNVDIRYNFPLGGDSVALVTGGNRTENTISIYKVNVETRALENVAARKLPIGLDDGIYGSCMYYSVKTGKFYAIINEKTGKIEQWELFDNGSGKVDGKLVRTLYVDSKPEGCVADDILAKLYVGEENEALWKFEAEPDAGVEKTLVEAKNTHFVEDIEGLSIFYADRETGYLIASSQGNNTFCVYTREGDNSWIGTFQVIAGESIDGTEHTDGLDVTNFPLGDAFPSGMFVAMDGINDVGNQNYKAVPWEAIAKGISPELKFNTTWDPRIVK